MEQGVHMEPAAQLAGLSPNTVRAWLKRGEDGESPFDLFLLAYKRAQGGIEAQVTKNIIKASADPRFWASGATYLERTHPDRWARRSDDSSAPKVVVQIGVRDSDVQVSVQAGNDNAAYQTQSLSEGVTHQALTAAPLDGFAGEEQGRK
jgi:hypothetical protein